MNQPQGFYDYLQQQFGDAATGSVPIIFDTFVLPEPRGGFVPIKTGALVPLDDYGLVFRVEQSEFRPWDFTSPHVLQPLVFFRIEKTLQAGLYPGTNSIGVTRKDYETLQDSLMRTSYVFVGDPDDDCGYIGEPTAGFPNGFPVVLDPNDLVDMRELAKISQRIGQRPDFIDKFEIQPVSQWYQTGFYDHVRRLAYGVLSSGDVGDRQQVAREFWHECHVESHHEIGNGVFRLRASWHNAGTDKTKDKPVSQAGETYRQILHADSFHAVVLH